MHDTRRKTEVRAKFWLRNFKQRDNKRENIGIYLSQAGRTDRWVLNGNILWALS